MLVKSDLHGLIRVKITAAARQHLAERAQLALAAAREELGLAEENLRLAEISYEAGASAYLDLEQARVGRDAARLTVTAETMNLDLANLSMLKATGDL